MIHSPVIAQIEICDNGIDDDGDLLIDLNDEDDCLCEKVEPISLIPNPSFEDMDCCPQERSELDCASSWIQASEPTTDYIHTCGWMGWDDFPAPMPFPDGQGIMGFRDGRVRRNNNAAEPYWKEYAGACLLSPLLKDSTYNFQFDVGFINPQISPPINVSFFGTGNCKNLPFGVGDEAYGCPTKSSDWVRLGDVELSGGQGNTWVNAVITATPDMDIHAIAIGPDCAPVSATTSIYYYFDNLLLADIKSFELNIVEEAHPCHSDFVISSPSNPDFSYQWYLEGIALVGETFAGLTQMYGEGSYQVSIEDGITCRLSATYEYVIPVISNPLSLSICQGDAYPFGELMLTEPGFYLDTFPNENNCDSIVALDLAIIGAKYDTLEANILTGESLDIRGESFSEAGEYPITLESDQGCDSLVLLKLELFNIYFPNIIAPKAFGLDNTFVPISADGNILSIELKIYDRWGNLLHEGNDWDGRSQNKLVNAGVYVYWATIEMNYDLKKDFYGSLTVLR